MPDNFQNLRESFRELPISNRAALLNHLIAIDRGRHDTEFFAAYFLGVDTNAFQRRFYEAIDQKLASGEMAEILAKAANRCGKTVALAVIHIKFAFYKIGISGGPGFDQAPYNTFDLSPVSRQAKQCADYVIQILEGRFAWEKDGKRVSNLAGLKLKNFFTGYNENLGRIVFQNGSKAFFVGVGSDQGAGIQGLSGGIITYDEAPLSHHLRDELTGNIYSRLGDYGRVMVLIGTPNEEGHSQQFFFSLYRGAKNGENNFVLVEGNYNENVFIDEKQRRQHAERIINSDPEKAKQVLEGAFVTTGGRMLDNQTIERIWNGKKDPTFPMDGHDYLISVDWGVADQGDDTVFLVWDYSVLPWTIVNCFWKAGGDPWALMAKLSAMREEYNSATVVMDTASMGGTMFKKMLKDLKPISFNAHVDGGKTKKEALTFMQLALTKNRRLTQLGEKVVETNPEFGVVRSYYNTKLEEQLAMYRADDIKLRQDFVSAFYIGIWWLYKRFFNNLEKKKSFDLHLFKRPSQHIFERP